MQECLWKSGLEFPCPGLPNKAGSKGTTREMQPQENARRNPLHGCLKLELFLINRQSLLIVGVLYPEKRCRSSQMVIYITGISTASLPCCPFFLSFGLPTQHP